MELLEKHYDFMVKVFHCTRGTIDSINNSHRGQWLSYFTFELAYSTIKQQRAKIEVKVYHEGKDILCETKPIFDVYALSEQEKNDLNRLIAQRYIYKAGDLDNLMRYESYESENIVTLIFVIPESSDVVQLSLRLIKSLKTTLANIPVDNPREFIKRAK